MLLSKAFEDYASDVIAFKNQSRKTMEMSSLALKSLLRHIGDIDVSELTFQHVRRWKESLEDERKSCNTVRGYIIKLRCVLTYLRKQRVECIDADVIPIPKRQITIPTWITPEDVSLLISHSNTRGRAVISLLYASGIRVSELCNLNRGDLREGRFTVIGKGSKARLCFYDSRTADYLHKYLLSRKDNNPALFTQRIARTRIRPTGVQEILISARNKAGFQKPITPHSLRHSFACDIAQNGIPIHSLQRLLGHANLSTTSVYLNVTDVKLEEEYTKYHKN